MFSPGALATCKEPYSVNKSDTVPRSWTTFVKGLEKGAVARVEYLPRGLLAVETSDGESAVTQLMPGSTDWLFQKLQVCLGSDPHHSEHY